jgi:c-di-AMP phosphodiesterase-like protein
MIATGISHSQKIMKNLLLLSFVFFSIAYRAAPERTVVSVVDTDNYYELRATFDESKSSALKEAIDQSIHPDKLFGKSVSGYDAKVILQDGTRFYIRCADTKLVIKFNKKANTAAAYERMKIIFAEAKKVLK